MLPKTAMATRWRCEISRFLIPLAAIYWFKSQKQKECRVSFHSAAKPLIGFCDALQASSGWCVDSGKWMFVIRRWWLEAVSTELDPTGCYFGGGVSWVGGGVSYVGGCVSRVGAASHLNGICESSDRNWRFRRVVRETLIGRRWSPRQEFVIPKSSPANPVRELADPGMVLALTKRHARNLNQFRG